MPTRHANDTPTICGVDEAGRGALAGPLVAAGVIFNRAHLSKICLAGFTLRDGKVMTRALRERVVTLLDRMSVPYLIRVASARTINSRGIQDANRRTIREIVRHTEADMYFIDGRIRLGRFPGMPAPVHTVVGGDGFLLPVLIAGIVAKAVRDRIMDSLSEKYPGFAWEKNAGYGTRQHIEAIRSRGPCKEHRRLYVTTALSHINP